MTAAALFAIMLLLACALAWEIAADAHATERSLVRLACTLYASLACAMFAAAIQLTDVLLAREIALIVFSLAPTALALALTSAWERKSHRVLTAALLSGAGIAALLAAIGAAFVGYASLFVGVCALLALAARHFRERPRAALLTMGASVSLIAGAGAFLSNEGNATIALSTFSSAAIVGLSLACSLKRGRVAAERA
jgi:hypothetical protein